MDVFEDAGRKATSDNAQPHTRIAGFAVMAASSQSQEDYAFSSGLRTLDTSSTFEQDMTCDTVLWIASVSKLMTAVAALSCVERGLISLDEDVTRVLPDLKDRGILEGFDGDGKPKIRLRKNIATLRQFLSHTSGMGYDIMIPSLAQWQGGKPLAFCGSFEIGFSKLPFLYEPGESWAYSASYDWAGKIVERLTGGTLGQYLSKIMWEPLDMKSTTFHLEGRPDLLTRLATLTNRTEDGVLMTIPDIYARPAKDESGGAGVFSTASDILKLLKSLLRKDATVLKPETTELLFTPQLKPCSVEVLETKLRTPETRLGVTAAITSHVPLNHSLAGLLALSDTDTGRKKYSVQWGGLPNLSWWIDPNGDRCGVYVSQMLPKYDQPTIDLKLQFESAVYRNWEA
ncbi:beta-lactamase/transpeptidase-like protein [Phaeosphaeriaceae sp. PMI808]|nr:beta-lactamase/transpeptidase-like protein [Phaeosphaeriaceae sp. PMI808]